MKKILTLLFCLLGSNLYAHDIHYENVVLRKWSLEKEHQTIEGSFYLFKDGNIFIEDAKGHILIHPLASFSKTDQQFVSEKYAQIQKLNHQRIIQLRSSPPTSLPSTEASSQNIWGILLVIGVLGCFLYAISGRKKQTFALSFVSASFVLVFFGFDSKIAHATKSQTDPAFLNAAFAPFKSKVSTSFDATYFYVQSQGIADHEMMAGITGWQQQVPIPQCYLGSNAWSIPLNPVIATIPVPVNPQHFIRGALALAVNGIPIFNPFTNTGVDALVDGQLDNFGGHSGRADDYHYHIAPLSLYSQTSPTMPIAFGLDGFPIYGSKEPDGSDMKALDANHGHYGSNGVYHYHGTTAYPYMIGNMVGKVTEDATMQIIPQAAATPVRPSLTPLKGAVITKMVPNATKNGYIMTYTLNNQTYSVDYKWTTNGVYTYNFISPSGTTTQTYNGFKPCTVPTANESETQTQFKVDLFPNPTNGTLNLQLGEGLNAQQIQHISIYNILGQMVYQSDRYQQNIEMKDFAKGFYLVKIQLPQTQFTQKVVVN